MYTLALFFIFERFSMFKDRRKFSRYPCDLTMSVEIGDSTFTTTECSNISLGGMCIVVDNKVDKSIKFGTLHLTKKCDSEEINFQAKLIILWSNFKYVDRFDTRIGVMFKDLDSENKENLQKIISTQSMQLN